MYCKRPIYVHWRSAQGRAKECAQSWEKARSRANTEQFYQILFSGFEPHIFIEIQWFGIFAFLSGMILPGRFLGPDFEKQFFILRFMPPISLVMGRRF
jgi:hypothetical protein